MTNAASYDERGLARDNQGRQQVGVIIVTYSMSPVRLVSSISSSRRIRYHVYHHGDKGLENDIRSCFSDCDASVNWLLENRGLAKSWNQGIMACVREQCDPILIINDDVCFKMGAFDSWVRFLDESQDHGIGFVYGDEPQENGGIITRSQNFSCFSLGRRAIEVVGAFDEAFVPAYFEDFDYFARVLEAGVRVVYCEESLIIHERSQTLKSSEKLRKELPEFFNRSREYFVRKWGGDTPEGRTFCHPFNDPTIPIFIPFR